MNTKYISSSELKISEFSRVRSKSENFDVFNSRDEIYLVFAEKSKFSFYFIQYTTGTQLLIVIIDATWNVNACYHEVSYASASSLRMRRSTCSVLGRLKYHMFCSRENKQSRVYKIGVHYDLQKYSMFPLEVNWNTYGTCVFQLMVYKVDR